MPELSPLAVPYNACRFATLWKTASVVDDRHYRNLKEHIWYRQFHCIATNMLEFKLLDAEVPRRNLSMIDDTKKTVQQGSSKVSTHRA